MARRRGPRDPRRSGAKRPDFYERFASSAASGSHMPLDIETHWEWSNPLNVIPALVLLLVIIATLVLAQILWQLVSGFADVFLLFLLGWLIAFILKPIIAGTWTEGRPEGEIDYAAGDPAAILEDSATVHCFWNRGSEPATALVCDIVPAS